jgi:hypothetical protein
MINMTLEENVKGTSLTTSLLYCEKLTMPLEKFDLTDIEKFFWLEKHSHGFPTRKHRRCLHNATEGPIIFSFLLFSKTFFFNDIFFQRQMADMICKSGSTFFCSVSLPFGNYFSRSFFV